MAKKTSTIKVSDLDRMINEEMSKIKMANEIYARLAVVQEELKRLQEDESVDEVTVGGTKSGEAYYQKGVPVPKFEKIGTHLKEDEPMIGDETVPQTFEEKLAAIGRELDMKLGSMDSDDVETDIAAMGGSDVAPDAATADAEVAPDAADDIEISTDDAGADVGSDDSGSEEKKDDDEEEIEIDEASIEVEKAGDPFLDKAKKGMNQMDNVGTKTVSEEEVKEEAEVKEAEVKEGEVKEEVEKEEECETMEEDKKAINESKDVLGKKKNPLLSKELERMRNLAGL